MDSYDLTCLPEAWLNSTTSIHSNDLLPLKGYNLYRVNDPDNVEKGRVCVNYKETLPFIF